MKTAARTILYLLAASSLYVLSLGPLCRLAHENLSNLPLNRAINAFLFPLVWLGRQSELIESLLSWYVDLWVP